MKAKELFQVFKDFCDYLAPLQTPYEQAIYMHLFRWSHLENGKGECRRGKRTIAKCALPSVRSNWRGSSGVSYAQVDATLKSLEKKGHVVIGDTTRHGTLYTIPLPGEIEEVRKLKAAGKRPSGVLLDYFNVSENRVKVFARDNWTCYYCEDKVNKDNATLDHLVSLSKGGDSSLSNLVTCCLECNSIKRDKSPREADLLLLKRYKKKVKRRAQV